METVRQFKKMSLWDFIDLMEQSCIGSGIKSNYLMYLDEIKMRRIESISEGGNQRLKALALQLLNEYQKEMNSNPSFSTEEEFSEFKYCAVNEI